MLNRCIGLLAAVPAAQVIVWVLGEYGHLAATSPGPRNASAQQVSYCPARLYTCTVM